MKPLSKLIFVLLLVSQLSGCYEVPVTGRKAMNLVDDKEVTKLSIAAFEQMKKQYRPSRDRARIEQLNRVGERISKVVFWDMPDADWEFVVFDVPQQINAFAMAGGKVGVFSGLFKIIENDDQLASVIAHEISHVTAKHIHQRLSQEMLVDTGAAIGGVALLGSGANLLTVEAMQQVYGLSTGVTGLAFDRAKEKEADYIGLIYMARAGYNPEESVKVLEKLDAAVGESGKNLPPAFLSTHPSNPERILQLLDEMPKALEARSNSGRVAEPVLVK
ncbi:MAG TPA: M48 family metallopeptidase [Opitutaceae bacterium]|nr:M48 family metallopeptidase [Opitutaceae bacterium]